MNKSEKEEEWHLINRFSSGLVSVECRHVRALLSLSDTTAIAAKRERARSTYMSRKSGESCLRVSREEMQNEQTMARRLRKSEGRMDTL